MMFLAGCIQRSQQGHDSRSATSHASYHKFEFALKATAPAGIHPLYWIRNKCSKKKSLGELRKIRNDTLPTKYKKPSLRKEDLALRHNSPDAKPILGRSLVSPLGNIRTFSENAPQNDTDSSYPMFTDLLVARNDTLCQRNAYPDKKP